MDFLYKEFDEEHINQVGLNEELKSLYIYNRFINKNKSILFVCNSLYETNMMYQSLLNYTDKVYLFPMDDFLTSVAVASSPELQNTRLETLNNLLKQKKSIIVTNLMGYLRFLPLKEIYNQNMLNYKVSDVIEIKDLINLLDKLGYQRETTVNKTGEYAVRGYVLDVFPNGSVYPIRFEFWDNEIDSIKTFNVDTQLTIEKLNDITIYPNSEFLLPITSESNDNIDKKQYNLPKYTNVSNILDYMDNPQIIYNNLKEITISYQMLYEEITSYNNVQYEGNQIKHMFNLDELMGNSYTNFTNIEEDNNSYVYNTSNVEINSSNPNEIAKELKKYLNNSNIVTICADNKYLLNKINDRIPDTKFVFTKLDELYPNVVNLVVKKINRGFKFNNYVFISEQEIFNRKNNNYVYKTNFKIGTKIRDISKLEVGDYIVHITHGIGRYLGIKSLEKGVLKKDYILLEYSDGDKLYVPVEKIDIISKYSNSDAMIPKLNKLGSSEWSKTKLKVKAKVEEMAHELLTLYAQREASKGFKFAKDDENQIMFENEFPFEETPDQLKAIKDIKADMEKDIPMDRLLCGDVGFGKTEVAFRAIFKAILSNKQAAILCPTTILSDQHYKNALERFKSFPVNIALLNRFVSYNKSKEIVNDLKLGKIDLLIGTHKILGKNIEFKDLGLLVIDEEQRFGVKHKEKIKEYKKNIDVLTLSATPIPRTLQMSLSGIRGLSLIETPPVNRFPIQTYVLSENTQIIKDAVYKEMSRNGQVFILYNNVSEMDRKQAELQKLVPEARIVYIHGQMDKNVLEDVMIKFLNKEYDILLCTTIIETGIDIPSVNTLIIYDADKYGLSQLYQIRGRVGRSDKIAYCYLMYNKSKILSDVATKRLNAIKDFTELGSGLSIAMRDLSIRGAGDILGAQQAGFVASVGIEMFMNMLQDEIDRLKGKEVKKVTPTDEQPLLDIETYIPDDYVNDPELKIEIHKKINTIDSYETLNKVKQELEDRFGKVPESLNIYMYSEWFEKLSKAFEIKNIKQNSKLIEIILPEDISMLLNYSNLFIESQKISKNIRFKVNNNNLIIIMDLNNLDKHFIYYLVDLMLLIKSSLKQ